MFLCVLPLPHELDNRLSNHRRLAENACPGGDFGIRAFLLDQPAYEALCYIMMRREEVAQLMLKRLGTDKVQALVSMAESYQVQIKEKQELLRNARKLSMQTRNEDLAQQYLQEAEELTAQVHTLETDYAAARDELDNTEADTKWVESTLRGIYDGNSIREIPTPEDIKAVPYEKRRLLLAATGLRAEVYPKNWTGPREKGGVGSTDRVEMFYSWELSRPMSER
jgi:hypothetical protein